MNTKRGLPSIVWALIGLLAIAGAMIELGRAESRSDPSVENLGAQGTSVLYATLNKVGFRVATDFRAKPALNHDDVAIAFIKESNTSSQEPSSSESRVRKFFRNYLRQGGRVVAFYVPDTSDSNGTHGRGVAESQDTIVNSQTGRKLHVGRSNTSTEGWIAMDGDQELAPISTISEPIWSESEEPLVQVFAVGKGLLVYSDLGALATNEKIDQYDNAALTIATVQAIAKPTDRLLFTEAAFGNVQDPGFLATIGAWATVSWWQAILLFGVIVVTLGRRFGLPEPRRRAIQSSRDLVDALADTLMRAKSLSFALRAVNSTLQSKIRHKLRLTESGAETDWRQHVPAAVRLSIQALDAAADRANLRSEDALSVVKSAEIDIERFTGRLGASSSHKNESID